MKWISVLISFGLFLTLLILTPVLGDAATGQKIFKRKFRRLCGFSGVKFARHHTQWEWEEIYEGGKFRLEAKKICPKLKLDKIQESWWPEVYQFSKTYASDGMVPKC